MTTRSADRHAREMGAADEQPSVGPERGPRLRYVVGPVVFVLVLVVIGSLTLRARDKGPALELVGPDQPATYEYVIPAGTAARIGAGEKVDLIPRHLRARVGEVIRIRNDDVAGQQVGPFYVGAGEVLTQRFASAGEYSGACAVHPSGEFILTVSR